MAILCKKQTFVLARALWSLGFCGDQILGGDFRWTWEKSSNRPPTTSMKSFNSFIEAADLIDIPLQNDTYTRSGYRHYHVSTLIDRFLMTEQVLQKFSFITSIRLVRPTFDRFQILLSIWHNKWGPTPFRFKNMWLKHKDFDSIIEYW